MCDLAWVRPGLGSVVSSVAALGGIGVVVQGFESWSIGKVGRGAFIGEKPQQPEGPKNETVPPTGTKHGSR